MTRALGWVQDGSDISKLKNIVQIFVPDSHIHKDLVEDKLAKMAEDANVEKMKAQLTEEPIKIDFNLLKGRGYYPSKGETRSTAPCSGIAQAVLPSQKGKYYQSDWAANSFILWAIAIGFLDYDRDTDKCSLSELGKKYAECSGKEEERTLLIRAHLSYPPVCRILKLLSEKPTEYYTKFEIGSQFGFTGENGFTCFNQRFILDGLRHCKTPAEVNKSKSNTEGTSDKYVRTIISWLKQLKLVEQGNKEVTEKFGDDAYSYNLIGYRLTYEGQKAINYVDGRSIHSKIPKIVYNEMLATKASDANYLRYRRALLIDYLDKGFKSIDSCVKYLKKNGLDEVGDTIMDDIRGFKNLGLNVIAKRDGNYRIADEITHLVIPQANSVTNNKSYVETWKDALRPYLKVLDHKYLSLIDMGFNIERGADRNYELMTADLLTTELEFSGARLGDANRPDVCVYYKTDGIIIDNKAYQGGFSLQKPMADEMIRYIDENKRRSKTLNKNEWWTVFGKDVNHYNYAFISSSFVGGFRDRLSYIWGRTGVKGAAINSVNLIYIAELLKSKQLSYESMISKLDCNDQILMFEPNIAKGEPTAKLFHIEDDQEIFKLVQDMRSQHASPEKIQAAIEDQYGDRYGGMSPREWNDLITYYLKPTVNITWDQNHNSIRGMAADQRDNSK